MHSYKADSSVTSKYFSKYINIFQELREKNLSSKIHF